MDNTLTQLVQEIINLTMQVGQLKAENDSLRASLAQAVAKTQEK